VVDKRAAQLFNAKPVLYLIIENLIQYVGRILTIISLVNLFCFGVVAKYCFCLCYPNWIFILDQENFSTIVLLNFCNVSNYCLKSLNWKERKYYTMIF